MAVQELLIEKREAIAQSWLEGALAAYPGDSAALFARERDPFANPIGHSLRQGIECILDALIATKDVEEIRDLLVEMMKIRAVQQFAPSQAVGFVFRLKEIVRAELGRAAADPEITNELAEFDARIDEIALAAFDCYVACREEVYELRVNEVKRQVSWIVGKVNQQDSDPDLVQIGPKPER
jgi:hypothetical protein